MMVEEKGAIPSEPMENGVSHRLIHPAGAAADLPKEKQIEEMAKDLQKSEHWYFDDHSVDFELDRKKTAENLYNAGYRKQSELTPCDVCRFNPPSSKDGKPCAVCPAQMKGGAG